MLNPLSHSQWNHVQAAHLLNRAGFGGTPREIEQLRALGPEKAVARLLDYESVPDNATDPDWAQPDPTRQERFRAMRSAPEEERRELRRQEQREQRRRLIELQGWWLNRMATTSRPFQEKMTLFWHGHFATSFVKVRDAYLMWLQNDLFRRHATGNWLELLVDVARDPAMLLWLDQAQSRKRHPNENFARELMELFTLGEGHYTEKDVTAAARAFTGWGYDRVHQTFVWRPAQHDTATKELLGSSGNLDGNDVVAAIVEQPQAARFISGKLWHFFAGSAPSPALRDALAKRFVKSGWEFRPLLRAIFLSDAFYSPDILRNQVKSPVQWLVGSVRMLERDMPPPVVSSRLTRNLGQELFSPPNVKGWDGGVAWITTNSLLARYNQAALLVYGGPALVRGLAKDEQAIMDRPMLQQLAKSEAGGLNVNALFSQEERRDKDRLIRGLQRRLLQATLNPTQEEALRTYLEAHGQLDDNDIRGAIRLIMATPDFQLT